MEPASLVALSVGSMDRKLFLDYQKSPSVEIRNEIVRRHWPFVKYLAGELSARVPGLVDIDDLIQDGTFGLIDSIEGYNPSNGTSFTTYSRWFIRGRMIDGLRERDWVPRVARARGKTFSKRVEAFRQEHGRQPGSDEIERMAKLASTGRRCNWKSRMVKVAYSGASIPLVNSLDSSPESDGNYRCGNGDKRMGGYARIADHSVESPYASLDRTLLKELIISKLTRAERMVVILYYYKEMTQTEIGKAIGISGSEVCNIHKALVERLKKRFSREQLVDMLA